jgi:hypothetical protein
VKSKAEYQAGNTEWQAEGVLLFLQRGKLYGKCTIKDREYFETVQE